MTTTLPTLTWYKATAISTGTIGFIAKRVDGRRVRWIFAYEKANPDFPTKLIWSIVVFVENEARKHLHIERNPQTGRPVPADNQGEVQAAWEREMTGPSATVQRAAERVRDKLAGRRGIRVNGIYVGYELERGAMGRDRLAERAPGWFSEMARQDIASLRILLTCFLPMGTATSAWKKQAMKAVEDIKASRKAA